jgi:hypothetical protein
MNHIERRRAEMQNDFATKNFTATIREEFISPTNHFKAVASYFSSKTINYELTRVEVYNQLKEKLLFSFFTNEGTFFHGWLQANNTEYLVCAEDVFGGQTIINLSKEQLASYSPGEDGFISTEYSLSPNGKTLAVTGCGWGSPYFIKLFNFSNPMLLPLPELGEIALRGNDEIITGWADNETLLTKGIKREYGYDIFDDDTWQSKLLSETLVERRININDTTLPL